MPRAISMNEQLSSVTPKPRCGIYARFSSDEHQDETSNEDQIRDCSAFAEQKGWIVLPEYILADSGKTGQTVAGRDGLADLLRLAQQKPRPYDYLLIYHTSRLGRDVGDANKLKATFQFFGITLIFVADGLDSRDSSFDTMFVFKSLQDQQFLRDLSAHVRKGQKGRFERGHVPGGGIPYGLRGVPHENVNKRGRYGRHEVDYVEWEIIPEEAAVLIQMFKAYAAGMSYSEIAKMLNTQGVKPPQAPRLRSVASWSKSAIREMLQNEKYIGIFRWNQSYQLRNPLTGKVERRYRPESEWLVKEMPNLRIIPQDLWERVCAQRNSRSVHAKQFGGRSRTSQARTYLLSGLLSCGICNGPIIITTSSCRDVRYGCSDHRYRGTCPNSMTISQPLLERKLLECLAANFADEARLDDIARLFGSELKKRLAEEADLVRDLASRKTELHREKAELLKQKQNVLKFVRELGSDDQDLKNEYTGIVNRIGAIDKQLTAGNSVPVRQFSEREIREFLAEQARHFAELLAGDPIKVKEELLKRVTGLVLTPVITDNARFYQISGDVRLFGNSEDVMQDKRGELLALHYTLPLRLEIAVRPLQRRASRSVLANQNSEKTSPLGGNLRDFSQEVVMSVSSLNTPSNEQQLSSPATDEIDWAFRTAKEPEVALMLQPPSPESAVRNGP
jgi:site-specific DNA recombinase